MAQYTINKKLNEYVEAIPRDVFENTPKAVWAAIAISFAMNLGTEGDFNQATAMVVNEWLALHLNGIIPQPTPHAFMKYTDVEAK